MFDEEILKKLKNNFTPVQGVQFYEPKKNAYAAWKKEEEKKRKYQQASILGKAGSLIGAAAKEIGESAQAVGTGIVRTLPGGTADLEAAARASEQQVQDTRMLINRLKEKGLTPEQKKHLQKALKSRLTDDTYKKTTETTQQVQKDVDRSAFAGNVAELGSLIVPGGAFVKGAQGAKAFLRPTLTSAVSGYVGGAGYELSEDPNKSLISAATSQGAVLGAVGGAAFPVVGKGIGKISGKAASAVSEFNKEVSKKLTPRQWVGNKAGNRLSALRESDLKTARAMVQKGEAKTRREALERLRSEGRNLEQIGNEYLASATKAQLYLSGKATGQKKGDSILDLITKSRGRGTEEVDNQFAIDMFDLEVRTKKRGTQLQADPTDVIDARIAAYKKANKDWNKELGVRKKYLDGLLDVDVKSGGIDKATADYIKSSYKTPAPINRLFDEDGLIRPEVAGGVRNVGKDNIARYIEGGITEIDRTFAPYVDRATNAFKQDARNRIRAEIDNRVTRGELAGTQHVKAETTVARNQVKEAYDALDKELKQVSTLIRRQSTNQRVARAKAAGESKAQKAVVKGEQRTNKAKVGIVSAKEKARINAANKRLATSTKKVINAVVKTRRSSALVDETTANSMQFVDNVVNKMNQKELVELSRGISGVKSIDEVRASITKAVARVEKAESAASRKTAGKALGAEEKVAKAQQTADNITGMVDGLRGHREALKQGKREFQEDISGLSETAPARANVIKYLKDGNVSVTEVDKGILKALENLEASTTVQDVIKYANIPSAALKAGWTSNPLLAPGFVAAKAVFNPWLMGIASRARVRDLLNPKTIAEAVTPGFRRAIKERGAIAEGALSTARTPVVSVDSMVAGRILKSPKAGTKALGNLLTSKEGIKATASKINTIGGFVDNAYRSWSAAGTKRRFYKQAVKDGVSKGQATEQALRQAADDYNEVLGNLQRTTDTIRGLEAVLPYSQAGQAGVSAFARAVRERPGETLSRMAVTTAVISAGVENFFNDPNAKEFIKEQYEAGRASQVDGWLFVPDPFGGGLKKNVQVTFDENGKRKETVNWEGAWKIRLPADFRPLAGMFYRGFYDDATGENTLTDEFMAGAFVQMGLGGIGADPNKTSFNPVTAFQQGSVGIISNILAGVDPNSGEKLNGWAERGAAASRELGSSVSWLTDYGNAFINEDGEFDMHGDNTGEFIAGALQRWGKGVKSIPKRLFVETAGVSDGSKIYKEVQSALKGEKEKTLGMYQQLHAYDEDDNTSGLFYNSTRAQMLIDNPDLFALEKKVAEIRNKYNGKPVDPVLQITDAKQRNAILSTQVTPTALRGSSNLNTAVYDSYYYNRYQQSRDAYYKQKGAWNKEMGYDSPADSEYPVPSNPVQKKLDTYYGLASRQKYSFKIANPDVLAHLKAKEDWENRRRQQYTNTTGVSLKLDNYYQ